MAIKMRNIGIGISLILAAILAYFANGYVYMQDIKSVPEDKIQYLAKAADSFMLWGCMVCLASWILANVMANQSKRLDWLWLPFVFTTITALLIGYQAEDMFLFKKKNGLWEGDFSLSYIFSGLIIFGTSVVLGLNYWALKKTIL